MRVISISVLALALFITPANGFCDDVQDEINFNQDPVITVDIDRGNSSSSNRLMTFAYAAVGFLGVYGIASWKINRVQHFNQALINKIGLFSSKTKSSL